jgi:amidase
VELRDYARHDGVGLRELIRTGEVTAAEVEAAARQAIERANADVNGLAQPLFEPALDHDADGPWGGVPFLIKDSGPMARGVPFVLGSRALGAGVIAQADTDLMTRFRAAGLVTLGLTTMPEMGISFSTEPVRSGPTRNPWNLAHGVGGSSGGAAALVAAGAVPVAHANDSAGSIRVPASCCGLVGLKPGRDRPPPGPAMGETVFGLLYEFVLTRTVRDAAHLLDAVHGPTAARGEVAPLRVGVTTRAWSGVAVDPEVAAATTRAATMLAEWGHTVDDASPAVDWESVIQSMVAPEIAFLSHQFRRAPRPPDPAQLEAVSRQLFEEATQLGVYDLLDAFEAQNRVSRAVGAFFRSYDLLVTPTIGQLPAPHGTLRYDDPGQTVTSWVRRVFEYGPFTAVFNIAGQPAISLPLGHSASGLPIGVQLVAGPGREDLLLSVAAVFEEAQPWSTRIPPHHVAAPTPAR